MDDMKKSKQAVALEYDPDDIAPKVIATGSGQIAERIISEASKLDIPIHEDDKLVKSLAKLSVGDAIPPELYEVVAEILVFVDSMDKLKGKMK